MGSDDRLGEVTHGGGGHLRMMEPAGGRSEMELLIGIEMK